MVSKASDDLPEPESPVNTISLSRGRSSETFRRLCSRAPRTMSRSDTPLSLGPGKAGPSPNRLQLALEVVDLVAEPGGVLEAEVDGRLVHLLLEGLDEPGQLLLGQLGEVAADLVPGPRPPVPARPGRRLVRPEMGQDVGDRLADGLGIDAVLQVVGLLHGPAPLGLRDGPPHGLGDLVG